VSTGSRVGVPLMPIFGERRVNLQLTERAAAAIERFLADAPVQHPLLSIWWARHGETEAERFSFGVYERADFREGWLGIAPQLQFAVIQDWLLDDLNDKVLDYDERDGKITLTEAAKTTDS
jgi:hypothetical protein